ncbi:lipopolysaccharide assembly protein LapB [uncultured Aquimarina sp.]|uniref:tetratricopeptide repeat protein n=1 Tax=uncultured Aquimarina sp. TaxID=575652 RepID=UPI00260307D6|nr:tetratricopeptide repeat protein [uncultured Aquimarina sp.]
MSIFKAFIYLIFASIIFLVIDGFAAKKEYYKGIIIDKKYANNTGLSGGSTTGETPFAPIPEQKTDPKGFSFSIRGESNQTVHVIPNNEMYHNASLGDSITYIKYKGLLTSILWNTIPQKLEKHPNNTNYLKIQREKKINNPLNKETLQLHSRIKKIYKKADTDLSKGIEYADSLIHNDEFLSKQNKIANIQVIIGEILYDNNQIDLALERFLLVKKKEPKHLKNDANIAGCYIKKGDYKKALELLTEASNINKDFKWLIGNYYEVIKSKPNAINVYKELYDSDNQAYSYCKERIEELQNSKAKMYEELKYLKRRERTIMLINNSGGFKVKTVKY